MKSFWWYKENSIAGMARPGFNSVRWFDLPFEEAVLLGWLGKFSDGRLSLAEFRDHMETYVPKIYKFHKLDEITGKQILKVFDSPLGVKTTLESLNNRLQIIKEFEVKDDHLTIQMNPAKLKQEIDHLKKHDIKHVVTLTEHHHHKNILDSHFSTYHISIADLSAPNREQVSALAKILKTALPKKEKLAVHCLAGIGRTSTMLVGAHIIMGESFKDLEPHIARQNPSFALTGPQAEFLRTLK